MTTKRKLLPCPLCGTKSFVTKLGFGKGNVHYNVSCGVEDGDSDTCGLVLYGDVSESRSQMIDKWNERKP